MAFFGLTRSRTSVASFNSTIRSSVDNGLYKDAVLFYLELKRAGLKPDRLTFPFVLKASSKLSDLKLSQTIHAHITKSPFSSDPFVGTAMVNMYVKSHQLNPADHLFDEMPHRDVTTWNALIMGYAEDGSLHKVLLLFRNMRSERNHPDSITIISLTQAAAAAAAVAAVENNKYLSFVRGIHCLGIRVGVGDDVSVANTWISAYAKCGDLSSAKLVFAEIPCCLRTIVSWNSMISGCAYLGKVGEVGDALRCMSTHGLQPDLATVLSLLSLFGPAELLVEGKMVHSFAVRAGFISDVSLTNALISLYSKCGDIEAAHYAFNTMPSRTSVTWTALISGYVKIGDIDEAMYLFRLMESTGEKPDAATVVSILSACSQTGNLDLGRSMSQYAASNGLEENVVVCNALIDMYAKCGSIPDARRFFCRMCKRTVVSWTAMITGYAMNGHFEEALDLFSEMIGLGIKPTHVTFIGVLQACAHGGFLGKGQYYFDMMEKVCHIEPRVEHYACMVDLLGRRGNLEEALAFIERMPIEPDAGVWGALLGACITHHKTEIGEHAANRLLELESHAAASYVGMANIYAAEERWEGVAKMRAMMKREGVHKLPGQSYVHVNGRGQAFSVEERHNPQALLIYEILDGLVLNLIDKGFHTEFYTDLFNL